MLLPRARLSRNLLQIMYVVAMLIVVATTVFILKNLARYSAPTSATAVWQDWRINGKPLRVETVSDPKDLAQGLGDRDSLPKQQGMLFEMGREEIHPFWMRHMRFPLDILWIRNRQVVEIAPNVPAPGPFSVPVTHTPGETADEVLELNAGEAKTYGLEVGSVLPGR